MDMLKEDKIPEEAKAIFAQNDQYREYITSLNYTVDSYNKIVKTATAEERSLIEEELRKIERQKSIKKERMRERNQIKIEQIQKY